MGQAPAGWAQTPPAASGTPTLTLAQALAAARDNSDVALARHALAGARADVLAADHAPAPVLSTKAASIDLQNGVGGGNVVTRKRIDKSIGIDWTWERGDKRALRTLAAQRALDAAQSDVQDMQTQQLQAALSAYYDLLAAQERLRETREIERGMAELDRVANLRLKAGDLARQDAARTRIESERARSDSELAELARTQAAVALAQLTARGPGLQACACDWPAQVAGPAPGGDLLTWAESRADVRAALARVQAAQAELDSAMALRKADVTIGASYDHYPGTSNRLVELRAQIPLQWGYRFEGEIGRAQAMLSAAQEALDKTRRLALLDLQSLQQQAASAAQRAAGYENGILPRAREVAQSAELAYAKGAIPLTDLLDARRTLRATALEALAARADYAKAQGNWLLRTEPQLLLP
ncbi:TolC family protein [Alicycliphilus denitrificans]|uniref:Outer membrane efflux protein n=3 Tax=Alicycliphilus denitrificans TaxID=179636 RepID=F4GBZ2_ALIDK|nr:outer membrane efflux protein [Alicycliphilus denitrificans BC]AEB82486.1 outer membrane efflux protein [Alicycliphilus denitrificans K601]QKD46214.1 TolC family protein [Alicycliphilus denitrificans]